MQLTGGGRPSFPAGRNCPRIALRPQQRDVGRMKVRELIDALAALDPELTVVMQDSRLEFTSPDRVVLDVVAPYADGDLQLCDYDDDDAFTVVRLLGPGEVDDRDERPKPAAS